MRLDVSFAVEETLSHNPTRHTSSLQEEGGVETFRNERLRKKALSDPRLCRLRLAGLLVIYRENEGLSRPDAIASIDQSPLGMH